MSQFLPDSLAVHQNCTFDSEGVESGNTHVGFIMKYDEIVAFVEEYYIDWLSIQLAMCSLAARAFFSAALVTRVHCLETGISWESFNDKQAMLLLELPFDEARTLERHMAGASFELLFYHVSLARVLAQHGLAFQGSHYFSQQAMALWDEVLELESPYLGTRIITSVQAIGHDLRDWMNSDDDSEMPSILCLGRYEQFRVRGLLKALKVLKGFQSIVLASRGNMKTIWYPEDKRRYGQMLEFYFDRYIEVFICFIEQVLCEWRLVKALSYSSVVLDSPNPCTPDLFDYWLNLTGTSPDEDMRAIWLSFYNLYPCISRFVCGM